MLTQFFAKSEENGHGQKADPLRQNTRQSTKLCESCLTSKKIADVRSEIIIEATILCEECPLEFVFAAKSPPLNLNPNSQLTTFYKYLQKRWTVKALLQPLGFGNLGNPSNKHPEPTLSLPNRRKYSMAESCNRCKASTRTETPTSQGSKKESTKKQGVVRKTKNWPAPRKTFKIKSAIEVDKPCYINH